MKTKVNLTFKSILYKFVVFLFPISLLLLTGCQTMNGGGMLANAEFEKFTPLAKEKRVIEEVKLRWEVRSDVVDFCAKSIGMGREQAYFTPPVACAVWHVAKKECVIITGTQTTHLALGHELRHCFEGHFHR